MTKIVNNAPPLQPKGSWIAVDLEISEANKKILHRPITGKFALCTFYDGANDISYVARDSSLIPTALHNIKNSVWIFHNAKFDLTHLRRWAHVPPRNKIWDTYIIEKILWGGYYDTFKLGDLARRYLDIKLDKSLQKAWEHATEVTPEMLEYAVKDSEIDYKICMEQRKIVKQSHWKIWTEIDLPALWAIMDFQGFRLDVERWKNFAESNRAKSDEIDKELLFNPRSPAVARTALSKAGFKGLPSTEEDTLVRWMERYPNTEAAKLTQKILDSRMYRKRSSTYGMSFINDHLEDEGNGVFTVNCNYNVTQAETGRMCIAGDTVLPTMEQDVRIEDLELTTNKKYHIITHTGKAQQILTKFYKSKEAMYGISTNDGHYIECTGGHRILTPSGWKSIRDLRSGDIICSSNSTNRYSSSNSIYSTDVIISIVNVGIKDVWDIEVENDHSYLAAGFINHNSATDPPMQTIPIRETSAFRESFIARPGHKLIVIDFSQQEIAVLAYISQDENLIEICNSGGDIYIQMAKTMYDLDIDRKHPLRKRMKSVVLGANYGMSAIGLAKKENISENEAEDALGKLRKAFPKVSLWMSQQERIRSKVFTVSGRIIYLNPYSSQCPRNALNGPIQGTAADMYKRWLGELRRQWYDNFDFLFPVVAAVHDEGVLDVPEKEAQRAATFSSSLASQIANEMCVGMSFKLSSSIGDTWAEKE